MKSYSLPNKSVLLSTCLKECHCLWCQMIWKLCKASFILHKSQTTRIMTGKKHGFNNPGVSNLLLSYRILSHNINIWIYSKTQLDNLLLTTKMQVYSFVIGFSPSSLLHLHIWFGNTSKMRELQIIALSNASINIVSLQVKMKLFLLYNKLS